MEQKMKKCPFCGFEFCPDFIETFRGGPGGGGGHPCEAIYSCPGCGVEVKGKGRFYHDIKEAEKNLKFLWNMRREDRNGSVDGTET